VSDAKKLHDVQLEAQKKRRQEASEKVNAEAMVSESTAMVDSLISQATAAVSSASGLASNANVRALATVEEELLAATEACTKGQEKIMKIIAEDIRNVTKGPLMEARRLMFRLKVKLAPLPANCKKQLAAIQARKQGLLQKAQDTVEEALRERVVEMGLTADSLFEKLGGSSSAASGSEAAKISKASLKEFLKTQGTTELEDAVLDVGLEGLEDSITRIGLQCVVQQYQRCLKEVALTPDLEVKGSNSKRRLAVGEIVEVLSELTTDKSTSLRRARCRALQDSAEGWVTVHGNQGTSFLERTEKPYFVCQAETTLRKEEVSTSEELRTLRIGEVLEVLEGPRQEQGSFVMRGKGKAVKDGATGSVLFKDATGHCFFEPQKLLVCSGRVALTDGFDIGTCSAVRKLEMGEVLEPLEEPKNDDAKKLVRVKVKTRSDSKEGWVTTRGNQGTVLVEDSRLHFTCIESVDLDKLGAESSKVRSLEPGEHFEFSEEPTKELQKGPQVAKGRVVASASERGEGWFSITSSVQPWTSRQQCISATSLLDAPDADAKVVRELQADELLVALEVPVNSTASGSLFVQVRAESDSSVGFINFVDGDGKAVLKTVIEKKK